MLIGTLMLLSLGQYYKYYSAARFIKYPASRRRDVVACLSPVWLKVKYVAGGID